MSKPTNYGPSFDAEDAVGSILDTIAKLCFYGGAIATFVGAGLLVFNYIHFQGNLAGPATAALSNISLMGNLLLAGAIAMGIGSSYMFWGEELLHALQIIGAIVLFAAPFYLPMITGESSPNAVGQAALGAIQTGGAIFGIIALGGLAIELAIKIRMRSIQGAKADALRYGKGIKEEKYQNKFMGKCWQLPYCRKFVRERCPIYHAKRTCWKERVGCMCEEEVIRNAMENRPIPKDAIAAARYIPVNNRITMTQKRERCRQCVIFNEHLKHQYRLMLPVTICSFVLFYVLFRGPLLELSGVAIKRINGVLGSMTYNSLSVQGVGLDIFKEVVLDCFLFVLLAYALKLLEYVIFKLKV